LLNKKITILLVDDHTLVRRGLRRLIEDEEDMFVVGETENGDGAVQLARHLNPRIVLMGYSLPSISGLGAARKISAAQPGTFVVMLTMYNDDLRVLQAQKAGVHAYLDKNADDIELISTIRRVVKGEQVFPDETRTKIAGHARPRSALSAREREILRLIVQGKSNREIAEHLDLSIHTVGSHRSRIMKTLGVRKAAGLVAYAIRNGMR
jgi:two-component system, NarL family, response regulator NreC